MNSETLLASRDMGLDGSQALLPDGSENSNKNFARDAFSFSLGYFNEDYTPISQPAATDHFLADKTGSDLDNNTTNLYNGNISSMVTTITTPVTFSPEPSFETLAQSNAYTYDRLNRLRESKSFANLDYSTNEWMNSGNPYDGRYHNQFTYNANGGMLTALAKNALGETIDNQTYHRPTTTNGRYINNRTYAITDAATQTSGEDLLDQQAFDNTVLSNNNYDFTEIGERNKDIASETELITWNVYGKKTAVKRINGSSKNNVKFDYDTQNKRIAKHVYTSDDIWINTEYYVRDAQGNLMATYNLKASSGSGLSYELTERHIYGSSSIGIVTTPVEMIGANTPTDIFTHTIGDRRFNGSNHLGNVLSVFTDKKIPLDVDNNGSIDGYLPEIIAANDYAPFGSRLTERTFNKELYPNSFNGKRESAELDGEQDYGERDYDPKKREFDNVDQLFKEFPWYSPYQFAGNKPIVNIDLDGLEDFYYGNALKDQKFGKAKDLMISTDLGIETYMQVWNSDKKPVAHDVYFVVTDFSKFKKGTINGEEPNAFTMTFSSQHIDENGNVKTDFTTKSKYTALGITDLNFTNSKEKGNNFSVIYINSNSDPYKKVGNSKESQLHLAETIYHELKAHVVPKIESISLKADESQEHYNYHGSYSHNSPRKEVITPNTPRQDFIDAVNAIINSSKSSVGGGKKTESPKKSTPNKARFE